MVMTSRLSADHVRALIRGCFDDLLAESEAAVGFVAEREEADQEIKEQREMSQERVADIRSQLLSNKFGSDIEKIAADLLKVDGASWHAVGTRGQLDLMSGVARALVEQQRLFQQRLHDRLGAFQATDPLFVRSDPVVEPEKLKLPTQASGQPKGLSVEQAVLSYLEYGRSQWVRKTWQARQWQLDFFCQHVGAQTCITSVTGDDVRSFRNAVRALHKNHGKMRGATFAQRQTENIGSRVSDKTLSIIFDAFRAFMRWAKTIEGLIATNPAEDIRIILAKKPKGQKVRRTFTAEELIKLFRSPIFTGCRSLNRRYAPGKTVFKDAKFWIPILGFYTGARLGELIQLHIRDVNLSGEIPFLSINEENVAGTSAGDTKHVKTNAGVRIIPLHPDVLELGFADFVVSRGKKKGGGRLRLFSEFEYGSDGQASTVASKWFARFMDSVGLNDPRLVFHSFRHNAEDAFRDAMLPQYVVDRIIGHNDGSTSSGYGEGASIGVQYQAVKSMRFKVRVPELLNVKE